MAGNFGNDVILQYAKESVYGTLPTMTNQLKISAEGFKYTPSKKEEGLLTGAKIAGRTVTLAKKTEGSIATLARPDDIGFFLLGSFGTEDQTPNKVSGSTAVYDHTFTLVDNTGSDTLPSFSVTVDRVETVKAYPGCKINTLSFSAGSEDFLKLDVGFVGREEVSGTKASGLSPSALIPFKFSNATVTVDSKTLEAVNVKFDLLNNLDALQTTLSGQYFRESDPGTREIKCDFEVLYDDDTDDIREDFFLTDDECAVTIKFESDQEAEAGYKYKLLFTLPVCQLIDASPNVSGVDRIKQTLSLKAVDSSSEPCTCVLTNLRATAY